MADVNPPAPESAGKPAGAKPSKSDSGQPMMHIRVASPFTVYFNEEALSISAENDTGPFDILPHHHNFITLLGECEILVRKLVGESRIQISGGVMHVKADQVVVFLNV
jgi:F0F1-type ATP synthase epsilon subunit